MLTKIGKRLADWMVQGLLGLIRLYQWVLSPWIGRQCRFYPTCSHYAHEAISTHGAGYGLLLTIRRLARCHPFHPGGVDPVPPAVNKTAREGLSLSRNT